MIKGRRDDIKYVIFDLDGVLWDLDLEKIGGMIAKKIGIDNSYHAEFSRRVYDAILEMLTHTEEVMTEENIISIFKKVIPDAEERYGITIEKLYEELSSTKYNYCYNNPLALKVIKYLAKKRYVLYIKTNWFKNVQIDNLKKYGYLEYFSTILGLVDQYLKPNPKSVGRLIGNKNPRNFIFIGDTPKKEIFLANYFGAKSIWLNENRKEKPNRMLEPTFEIRSINEIFDIL